MGISDLLFLLITYRNGLAPLRSQLERVGMIMIIIAIIVLTFIIMLFGLYTQFTDDKIVDDDYDGNASKKEDSPYARANRTYASGSYLNKKVQEQQELEYKKQRLGAMRESQCKEKEATLRRRGKYTALNSNQQTVAMYSENGASNQLQCAEQHFQFQQKMLVQQGGVSTTCSPTSSGNSSNSSIGSRERERRLRERRKFRNLKESRCNVQRGVSSVISDGYSQPFNQNQMPRGQQYQETRGYVSPIHHQPQQQFSREGSGEDLHIGKYRHAMHSPYHESGQVSPMSLPLVSVQRTGLSEQEVYHLRHQQLNTQFLPGGSTYQQPLLPPQQLQQMQQQYFHISSSSMSSQQSPSARSQHDVFATHGHSQLAPPSFSHSPTSHSPAFSSPSDSPFANNISGHGNQQIAMLRLSPSHSFENNAEAHKYSSTSSMPTQHTPFTPSVRPPSFPGPPLNMLAQPHFTPVHSLPNYGNHDPLEQTIAALRCTSSQSSSSASSTDVE